MAAPRHRALPPQCLLLPFNGTAILPHFNLFLLFMPLVLVTHNDDLAHRCSRVIRLRAGAVVEDSDQEGA